jgi:hypothetical protein
MISVRDTVNKAHWSDDECAYVVRIDDYTRRFVWWMREHRGNWCVQMMDNEGNQIGDAEYFANKDALA